MKQRTMSIYGLIILFGFVLGGCATFQGIPTYSYYFQDQEVMYGIFRLKIEEAYWTDQTEMYATENMPAQYVTQIPKVKPDAKFLIITVSITNTGRTSSGMRPVWFTVRNEQGYEYSPSQKAGTPGVIGGFLKVFNPNMPVKTKIAFDVPGGIYNLIVSRGAGMVGMVGEGLGQKGEELFEWKLSPVSKE